ncbi:MAG TPA: GNAT family N-acetyltransferase [Arenimonas sp.]|uniref:GNAT family N-acetyltransferase n=1 Tax=Arenimonas sp. TaxID=1872635 RepID=UPI002D80F8EB|nr:GNAT family N-acetyltransferase [Arenimonas sp.]HEU0152236.1 GNAT family N-acetyltransferase [Arenimonas sp.]
MAPTLIDTPRLRLSELDEGDAAFALELLNTEGFLQHIGDRGVRSLDDARRFLREGPCASYAANGFGLWKVTRKSDGATVGMSGLVRRESLPKPDLGYAFLPAHAGQGLASEAGAAVLGHAFGVLRLAQVLAIVSPDNAGSVRVLQKLGMREWGLREFDGKMLRVFTLAAPGHE